MIKVTVKVLMQDVEFRLFTKVVPGKMARRENGCSHALCLSETKIFLKE